MQFFHTVHCFIFKFFTINVGIGTYFVYFHWYLKKDDTSIETIIC